MSVLLYHFGVPGFSGGFVGVDVFFVISGFLITRIIVNEVSETGSLSFSRFYTRRARRLFPAAFTTIAASFVLSFLLFSAEQFERFAGSAVFAIASLSNFFFWSEAGYFDAEAFTKPLLHTWSLSVEEQFYLIWPALLLLILTRFRKVSLLLVALICMVSLAIAEYFLYADVSAAFFLLPGRIVELGIGAGMVWLARYQPSRAWVLEPILLTGLAMITIAVFIYTPETRFPGVSALLPCLGSALALYAGQARFAGMVLRNPASVAIGKWSYSIYLVHWPLYVFFLAYAYRTPLPFEQAGLVVMSICLGWAQYRFIEERFRHERASGAWSRPAYSLGCALLAIAMLVPAATTWAGDGAKWRIPQDRIMKSNADWRDEERKTYCLNTNGEMPKKLFPCQNFRGKDKDIVLWGDSHSLHLIAGFSERFQDYNVYVSFMDGCVPYSGFDGFVRPLSSAEDTQKCIDRNRETLDFVNSHPIDMLVVTSAKRGTPVEVSGPINALMDTVTSAQAYFLADFIRPGTEMIDCVQVPNYIVSDAAITRRCKGDPRISERELRYNVELAGLIKSFVPVNGIQCPDGCRFFDGATPLFRDTHHLTIPGSIKFVKDIDFDRTPPTNTHISAGAVGR